MGRRWRGLVLLGVLASGAVALPAASADPSPTAAATPDLSTTDPSPTAAATPDLSTTRWTRNRSFQVSYVSEPSPPPLLTVHSWTVTILDAAGKPVSDARVTVLGGMPAHGHGFPTTPQIKELGGGRYLIEGLKFHMPGAWVVGLRIKAGTTVDSVNFDVQLD